MSRKAISAFVGSVLIGVAFASQAVASDDSEARYADHSTYSSAIQAGSVSANKIVGTGLNAKSKKIVGTGRDTKGNKIVGTGRDTKGSKIVGTGRDTKGKKIVGTGQNVKGRKIVGTGRPTP
jgi:hypothetical protein